MAQQGVGIGRWLIMVTVALFASILVPSMPTRADTMLTVNSTADPATGTPANCAPTNTGTCTLRDAVAVANTTTSATITFSHSINPNFTLNSPLALSAPMTIQGNGAASTIVKASSASSDVFDVTASGPVSITGLSIAYGRYGVNITGTGGVTVTADSLFGNATGIANGAGARVTVGDSALFGNTSGLVNSSAGTVELSNGTITNNVNPGGLGGGIFNVGTLTVDRSTLTQNSAGSRGGAAIANLGTLTVTNSVLSGNTASGYSGGGIYNSGSLMVADSTISQNTAVYTGGGIYNNGTATVLRSTVAQNSTVDVGGSGQGGGIFTEIPGVLTVADSTLSGNSSGVGGGIGNFATVTVTNSTLAGNAAHIGGGGIYAHGDAFAVTNTLTVDNTGGDVLGGLSTDSHNITGSFVFADPDPTQPQDHGGPSKTLALPSGSLAIGAGDPAACAAAPVGGLDQRDQPRPTTVCDIGAYEYQGKAFIVAALTGPGSNGNVPVTVFATDGARDLMPGYRGAVHVASTDPAGGSIDYQFTDADAGRHTFPSLFATAGNQTVTATDGALTGAGTVPVPVIVTRLSLSSGDIGGGGTVTITGANFGTDQAAVGVTFGGAAATVAQVTSASITVRVPPHGAGVVDVTVAVNGASATKTGAYIYGVAAPLPTMKPAGPINGATNPLPAPRATGAAVSPTNPLPAARP